MILYRCACRSLTKQKKGTFCHRMAAPGLLMNLQQATPRHFSGTDKPSSSLFLHVGPSGDCWTGSSIFAAKHLQPDYVKSVPLPIAIICAETLVEVLEEDTRLAQQVYDEQVLSEELLERVRAATREKEED